MVSKTPKAEKLLNRHLQKLRQTLAANGQDTEGQEIVLSACREQIEEMLSEYDTVDATQMAAMLDGLEPVAAWSNSLPGRETPGGRQALQVSLAVVAGLIFSGVLGAIEGVDGGMIMSVIALFGLPTSLWLGWKARHNPAGRAALTISTISLAVLFLAIVVTVTGI